MEASWRRGGCDSKKMSRSDRSGADGVVAHNASCMACERPPRPLQIWWLRTIFLDVAPPLLCKENTAYPNQFVHALYERLRNYVRRCPQLPLRFYGCPSLQSICLKMRIKFRWRCKNEKPSHSHPRRNLCGCNVFLVTADKCNC
jgi:hypothetical protein